MSNLSYANQVRTLRKEWCLTKPQPQYLARIHHLVFHGICQGMYFLIQQHFFILGHELQCLRCFNIQSIMMSIIQRPASQLYVATNSNHFILKIYSEKQSLSRRMRVLVHQVLNSIYFNFSYLS